MQRKLLLLLSILMLCACAGNEKETLAPSPQSESRPEWVDTLPQQQGALYGVSSVKLVDSVEQAEQQAKQQAVSDLKRQVQTQLQQQRSQLLDTTKLEQKIPVNLHQEIATRTSPFTLSFIEPVESYCDVEQQRVYALAKLDVSQEIAAAKRESEQLNVQIQQHAKSIAENEKQVLRKVQEITKTLVALERRQQLHVLAAELQPDGVGLPLSDELLHIQKTVLQGVEQTPISISPLSGYGVDITINQVLSEQLRQRGLIVVPDSGQLQLRYKLTQVNRYQNDTFFVTINGLIELHDVNGLALMSLEASGSGDSPLEDEAIRDSLAELGQLAAEEVIEVLFGAK